jgi:hypothetical protein
MGAIGKQVFDDDVSRLASQRVGKLKKRGGQYDKTDFKHRISLDQGNLAEVFAPYKVELAEEPTKDAAYYTKDDEHKVVHRLVFDSVFGLEKDKFASASRIEELQDDRRSQTAEESSPKDLAWEVCADLRMVSVGFGVKLSITSS